MVVGGLVYNYYYYYYHDYYNTDNYVLRVKACAMVGCFWFATSWVGGLSRRLNKI